MSLRRGYTKCDFCSGTIPSSTKRRHMEECISNPNPGKLVKLGRRSDVSPSLLEALLNNPSTLIEAINCRSNDLKDVIAEAERTISLANGQIRRLESLKFFMADETIGETTLVGEIKAA